MTIETGETVSVNCTATAEPGHNVSVFWTAEDATGQVTVTEGRELHLWASEAGSWRYTCTGVTRYHNATKTIQVKYYTSSKLAMSEVSKESAKKWLGQYSINKSFNPYIFIITSRNLTL